MMQGKNKHCPRELVELHARLLQNETDVSLLDKSQAGVALILQGPLHGLQVVLIKRTQREGDPWSGHLALPGGRLDQQDFCLKNTAIRETREEIGVDLNSTTYLGKLQPFRPRLKGAAGPVIHPYIFWHEETFIIQHDPREVDAVFLLKLEDFFKQDKFSLQEFELFSGVKAHLPAMDLSQGKLWGMTYAIMVQFLEHLLLTPLTRHYWQNEIQPVWWRGPLSRK